MNPIKYLLRLLHTWRDKRFIKQSSKALGKALAAQRKTCKLMENRIHSFVHPKLKANRKMSEVQIRNLVKAKFGSELQKMKVSFTYKSGRIIVKPLYPKRA